MLVPKLRFKREDGISYPEWKKSKISELFEISAGGDIDKANSTKEYSLDYPYAVYANALTNKGLYGYANYYRVDKECFTVTGRGDIGYAVARHEKFVPIVRLLVCIPKHNENVDCFAEIVNNTEILVESTGVPQLTSIQLGKIEVQHPVDIEEQQKIADFLSAVDEIIAQSQAEVQNLEKQKKAAMQKIFSQEVRFKREDGTDYPEWEEKAISELFEISAGGDIDKANSAKEYSEDYPYAVYANALINKGLYGYANYYKVERDCFTVTGRGDVGYAVARHEKFVPIVRLLVCIPKHNENVDFFAEIVNYTNILVESTGVPQLTSIQLGKIEVQHPVDIEEQQKIANFLSAYDEAITCAKQELEHWKQLKKGLLQQMFV